MSSGYKVIITAFFDEKRYCFEDATAEDFQAVLRRQILHNEHCTDFPESTKVKVTEYKNTKG